MCCRRRLTMKEIVEQTKWCTINENSHTNTTKKEIQYFSFSFSRFFCMAIKNEFLARLLLTPVPRNLFRCLFVFRYFCAFDSDEMLKSWAKRNDKLKNIVNNLSVAGAHTFQATKTFSRAISGNNSFAGDKRQQKINTKSEKKKREKWNYLRLIQSSQRPSDVLLRNRSERIVAFAFARRN